MNEAVLRSAYTGAALVYTIHQAWSRMGNEQMAAEAGAFTSY